MAVNEIDVRAEGKMGKPGLLLGPKGCVTEFVSSQIHAAWPAGYVLPWWGRPSPGHGIGPSVYYWRGRVPAHGARPHGRLKGFVAWRDITEMLVEHRIISCEPNSALHLCQGLGEQAGFKQGPREAIAIVPITRLERDRPRGQGKGLVDLDAPL